MDRWLCKDWGKKNGINVTIDHIPHLELPARAAAEVAAGAGHDIFGFNGSGGPHLFSKHTADMTQLVGEVERKYGKVRKIGRQIAYDEESKSWSAFPDYFIDFPGLYRKDLWDEIGMKPDTWDDIRMGGAKLKAKGTSGRHRAWAFRRPQHLLPQHAVELRRVDCDETGKQASRSIPKRRSRS